MKTWEINQGADPRRDLGAVARPVHGWPISGRPCFFGPGPSQALLANRYRTRSTVGASSDCFGEPPYQRRSRGAAAAAPWWKG